MIDLASSKVTKTDGFSVGLAGYVDISCGHKMASQIRGIKRSPLVQGND